MRTLTTSTALALLLGIGVAHAASDLLDADNDGMISAEELRNYGESTFSQLDVNDDGELTRDEIGPMMSGERTATLFSNMDADGDGEVTRAEYRDFSRARYEELGVDATVDDYAAATSYRSIPVGYADVDRDEMITGEEAAWDTQRQFTYFDMDNDRVLTEQEFTYARNRDYDQPTTRWDEVFARTDPGGEQTSMHYAGDDNAAAQQAAVATDDDDGQPTTRWDEVFARTDPGGEQTSMHYAGDDDDARGLSAWNAVFLRYDTNDDGVLTREEWLAGQEAEFTAADVDQSGDVDHWEYWVRD